MRSDEVGCMGPEDDAEDGRDYCRALADRPMLLMHQDGRRTSFREVEPLLAQVGHEPEDRHKAA